MIRKAKDFLLSLSWVCGTRPSQGHMGHHWPFKNAGEKGKIFLRFFMI